MHLPHDAMLLRIFIGESDRWQHKALYEAIVLKAREMHMAGATVLRGPMGYGKSSRLHTAKILRLSMDLASGTAGVLLALGAALGDGAVELPFLGPLMRTGKHSGDAGHRVPIPVAHSTTEGR